MKSALPALRAAGRRASGTKNVAALRLDVIPGGARRSRLARRTSIVVPPPQKGIDDEIAFRACVARDQIPESKYAGRRTGEIRRRGPSARRRICCERMVPQRRGLEAWRGGLFGTVMECGANFGSRKSVVERKSMRRNVEPAAEDHARAPRTNAARNLGGRPVLDSSNGIRPRKAAPFSSARTSASSKRSGSGRAGSKDRRASSDAHPAPSTGAAGIEHGWAAQFELRCLRTDRDFGGKSDSTTNGQVVRRLVGRGECTDPKEGAFLFRGATLRKRSSAAWHGRRRVVPTGRSRRAGAALSKYSTTLIARSNEEQRPRRRSSSSST